MLMGPHGENLASKRHPLRTAWLLAALTLAGCGSPSDATATAVAVRPLITAAAGGMPTAAPLGETPVVYDDDGSPDGTTALLYLLSHAQVTVAAVGISFGEAYPEVYIQHIGRKLDQLGVQGIALGAGQDMPLAGDNQFPEWLREGANEFWGHPIPNADKTYPVQDAAELIVSIAKQSTQPIALFVSGPATNLARALRLDPAIRDRIAAVYVMGGAVYVPGNIDDLLPDTDNRVAEWNIYADPLAAREVFESGLPIYLVPLDATDQVAVAAADTARWRQGGPTADFAADIYDSILDGWDVEEAPVWDLMTAAIMVDPSLCGFRPLHLEIDTTEGETSGQTVPHDDRQPNAQVCLEPDVQRIRQTLNEVFAGSR